MAWKDFLHADILLVFVRVTAMGFKTYLILIYNIRKDSFFDAPLLKRICNEGVSFDFAGFRPTDPDTAITCLMTGSEPGNTAYLKAETVFTDAGKLLGIDRTLPFLLNRGGLSIAIFQNSMPYGDGDFCVVALDGLTLTDKVIESIRASGSNIFIAAPVFHGQSDKAVNINTFLRKLELIETDSQNNIVWENSLAHHAGYGQLWVNLIGRDSKGTVFPGDEYEDVRNALIAALSKKLKDDKTGETVIDRVYKKEELFSGDYLSSMPDLVVSLKRGYGFSKNGGGLLFDVSSVLTEKTVSYLPGGGVAFGGYIKRGGTLADMQLTSIAPSILYCLGELIPCFMDGMVDERIFDKSFISSNPQKQDSNPSGFELSDEDENRIKAKLRGLGYLD